MGHVLRALKKAADPAETINQPVVQVVKMAVTNAQQVAKAKLDEDEPLALDASAAQATAAPTETPEPEPLVEASSVVVADPPTEPVAQVDPPASAASSKPAPSSARQTRSAKSVNSMIVTFHQPRCEASEQVRQLRTALIRLADRGPVRCMVTSARPREGKTITTANLAFSFSEIAQKRTLLVDADLRRGRLAELLGVDAGPGFGELLAGRCSLEEAIRTTARPNLNVIPAGEVDRDEVARLLSGESAEHAVSELFRRYQYVILDTPPAAHVADASIIGRWVRDALLAVRIHATPRQMVAQAVQVLENAGVNIAGIVALDEEATGRGYHRYANYA